MQTHLLQEAAFEEKGLLRLERRLTDEIWRCRAQVEQNRHLIAELETRIWQWRLYFLLGAEWLGILLLILFQKK